VWVDKSAQRMHNQMTHNQIFRSSPDLMSQGGISPLYLKFEQLCNTT